MAYGTVKVDNIVFDDGGSDQTVTVSGLYNSLTSGITVTGTISGAVVIGSTSVSGTTVAGVTVTGTTVQGASGTFTSLTGTIIQGTTATYTTGSFTSLTGTITTGTTANFVSGVFTTSVSGTTVIAPTGTFTSLTGTTAQGTTATYTTGSFTSLTGTTTTGTTLSFTSGVFTTLSGATATFTSGIIASGTAAAPSLAILGDPDTGVFSPGANQLAVATNGTGRLFINETGQVGIGMSGSAIEGALSTNDAVVVRKNTDGWIFKTERTDNSQECGFQSVGHVSNVGISAFTNNTERLRITSAGLVGIGTSAPGTLFHVEGTQSSQGEGLIRVRNNHTTSGQPSWGIGITRQNSPTRALLLGSDDSDNASIGVNGNFSTIFGKDVGGVWSEFARIDSSGRLLVGTSSALTSGDNRVPQVQVITGNTNNSGILLGAFSDGSGRSQLNFLRSKNSSGGTNTVVVNGDILGEISWNGADGTNYIRSAQISAEVDGTPGANDMPGRLVFSTTADGASSPTGRMRIDSGGTVSITGGIGQLSNKKTNAGNLFVSTAAGTNTGGVSIESYGTATTNRIHFSFSNPNGVVGSISTSASATAYNTSSDYRLKENVVDLDGAIDRLKLLPVHRFNFIADPDIVVDGFIAHEAAEVVPECVTGAKDEVDEDGNPVYQGIDQSKIVPLLTAALQEAVAKIETLEQRLAAAGID